LHLFCAALFLCAMPLPGQTPVPADATLGAAEQAIASHLPEVAIAKLQNLMTGASLDAADQQRAEDDLSQAMLDSGNTQGVLARLSYPSTGVERFIKAEALASLGQWEDALPLYATVAAYGPTSLRDAATLGQAEALHALQRDPEARAILALLERHSPSTLIRLRLAELYLENAEIEPAGALIARCKPQTLLEKHWFQYVRGRLYLAEQQDVPALEAFQDLLNDPAGLTPALYADAAIGLTEARIALNGLEAADDVLEDFIWHHPESPYLEEMFRRLDRIYAAEESPSDSELQHWAMQPPERRAALAQYYEGHSLQNQGRREKAIRAYMDFVQRYPAHPLDFEAWMQLGNLYLDKASISQAIDCFDSAMRYSSDDFQRARAEIASGNADFAQSDFLHAQELFHDAAARSPDLWLQATYDSALAWLHLRNYDRFLVDYTALSHRFPETDERRNLILEEGLLQAYSGDPRAAATLESFIRDFPDNRRVSEAQIALAELVYAEGDAGSAIHLLKAAYDSSPSPQSLEQADYFAIFLAASSSKSKDDEVIRLGNKFLNTYPASTLRPQVRMKLGQLYFAREDYANAQTQFETLAEESPADPLADKALILAGESAVRAMSPSGIKHAIDLFEQVAQGTGPLRLYARQEEALLKVQTGRYDEALLIYDDILRSKPGTDLRLAALCGKADCLFAGAANPPAEHSPSPSPVSNASPAPADNPFATAVALYDQVASDPDATVPWRDQALYKKARCLSKEGLNDKALESYYEVLNPKASAAQDQPDFFWFEKAGYDAAAMLEAKAQWPGAIAILEKVAQAGGPRSAEARKQADQLRLEHFVWD
jgi:tetratricopeptide (TPR) repeat protein